MAAAARILELLEATVARRDRLGLDPGAAGLAFSRPLFDCRKSRRDRASG